MLEAGTCIISKELVAFIMLSQFFSDVNLFIQQLGMQRSLNPQRVNVISTEGSDGEAHGKKAFFKTSRALKEFATSYRLNTKADSPKIRQTRSPPVKPSRVPPFQNFKGSPKTLNAKDLFKRETIPRQQTKSSSNFFMSRVSDTRFLLPAKTNPLQNWSSSVELSKQSLPLSFLIPTSPSPKKKFQYEKFRVSPTNKGYYPSFFNRKRTQGSLQVQEVKTLGLYKVPSFIKKHSVQEKKTINALDFKIIKKLGSGNVGDFYLAMHRKTGSVFTVKSIKKSKLIENGVVQTVIKSVKRQSAMRHPNVRKVYGVFDDELHLYLVMEYMDISLKDLLKEKLKLAEKDATQKLYQVAQGLKHIHQNGFIHRNIQIQSVLLCHNVCKISGFDLCIAGSQAQHQNDSNRPKLDLMNSSVQSCVIQPITPSYDIWCLGSVAYHLFTGKSCHQNSKKHNKSSRNYNAPSLTTSTKIQYPKTISKQVKNLIQKMLQPVSKDRISLEQLIQEPLIIENKDKNDWNEPCGTQIQIMKEKQNKKEQSRVFLKKKFSIAEI